MRSARPRKILPTGWRRATFLLALCCLGVARAVVAAGDPVPARLTMAEAVRSAQTNNAELQAARTNLATLRARVVGAGAYPNPGLSIDGSVSLPQQTDYDASVGIDQPISILGKVPKRIALAEKELEREAWSVSDFERRIAGQVRTTYRQAQVIDRRIGVSEQLAAVNQRLLDVARARFGRGEVSELDVHQFESELTQRRQEVGRLQADRRSASIELSRLLNAPPGEDLTLASDIAGPTAPFPMEPLLEAAGRRSDLKALKSEAEAGRLEKMLRTAERWGDPSVGVFYRGDRGQFDDPRIIVDRDYFVGARITVPLPLLYRNQGEIAAAEARRQTAEARYTAEAVNIDRALRDAHQRAMQQLQVMRDLDGGIHSAEKGEQLAELAYRDGLINAVQLVQTQQQLFNLMAASIDAKDAYYRALSEIEGTVNASVEEVVGTAQGAGK